jgi:hypothetical protein
MSTVRFAEDRGFSIVGRVLREDEIDRLTDEVSSVAKHRTRAGVRHLLHLPAVANFAADSRLMVIARGFLREQPFPFRATLFDKWGPWSAKSGVLFVQAPASALAHIVALRLHLDDSDVANGSLRVVPGSHRAGVLSKSGIDQLARRAPSVDCIVPRCGVVAMRPLLMRSSLKAVEARPRRVLHIEYSDASAFGPAVRLAVA